MYRVLRYGLLLVVLLVTAVGASASYTLALATWNVNSMTTSTLRVAEALTLINHIDLWGLCEVRDSEVAAALEEAVDSHPDREFQAILGQSGGQRRLLVLYDASVLEELSHYELAWSNRPWYGPHAEQREPLVVQFRHIGSGAEFLFVVNQLYTGYREEVSARGLDVDQGVNEDQATVLSEWSIRQSLPIIAVGDFGFDWDLEPVPFAYGTAGYVTYSPGYEALTASGAFSWVVPWNLQGTVCPSDLVQDFVFVAHSAGKLNARAQILTYAGCGELSGMPDHMPVEAFVQFLDQTP